MSVPPSSAVFCPPHVLVSALPLLQLIKRLLNRRQGHSGGHQRPRARFNRVDPACGALHPGVDRRTCVCLSPDTHSDADDVDAAAGKDGGSEDAA